MSQNSALTGGNATAVSSAVGGSDAALSWSSILAFGAIMVAAMQGTLVMESADPCRISFRKLRILLVLEGLEVAVALASEIFSFVQLRGALSSRLQWLQWVAPCLLCIGFFDILLDVYFTLHVASVSRVFWIPFSAAGWKADNTRLSLIAEIVPLLFTACASLCLIGWRQRWWWAAQAVTASEAISAAKQETAVSIGAFVLSVLWALFLTVGATIAVGVEAYFLGVHVTLLGMEFAVESQRPYALFRLLKHIFRPNGWWELQSTLRNTTVMGPHFDGNTAKRIRKKSFQLLHKLKYAERDDVQDIEENIVQEYLLKAPLHVGNAIVGIDKGKRDINLSSLQTALLVSKNLAIIPLQICVVVAVAHLSDNMDAETFSAFEEISNAVIVLALIEIAVGLKNILWGVGGGITLHEFDKTWCDDGGTRTN